MRNIYKLNICSAFAGGTKYAKRNFNRCLDVSVPFIHIADRPDDIIMHTVQWPIRDTFGHSQHGIGFPDPSIPIVWYHRCITHIIRNNRKFRPSAPCITQEFSQTPQSGQNTTKTQNHRYNHTQTQQTCTHSWIRTLTALNLEIWMLRFTLNNNIIHTFNREKKRCYTSLMAYEVQNNILYDGILNWTLNPKPWL